MNSKNKWTYTFGNSLFTHCLFDIMKNKLDKYRGTDSLEIFFKDLKEHANKFTNHEK